MNRYDVPGPRLAGVLAAILVVMGLFVANSNDFAVDVDGGFNWAVFGTFAGFAAVCATLGAVCSSIITTLWRVAESDELDDDDDDD